MKNMIEVMSVKEFEDVFDDNISSVSLDENSEIVKVYVSSNIDCPYIGCKYVDGRYSVVGCSIDMFCSYETMMTLLEEA